MNGRFVVRDVLTRLEGEPLVRYRCVEELGASRFWVISKDYLQARVTAHDLLALEVQFVELMSDSAPNDRSPACSSLEQAIDDFERDFSDSPDE